MKYRPLAGSELATSCGAARRLGTGRRSGAATPSTPAGQSKAKCEKILSAAPASRSKRMREGPFRRACNFLQARRHRRSERQLRGLCPSARELLHTLQTAIWIFRAFEMAARKQVLFARVVRPTHPNLHRSSMRLVSHLATIAVTLAALPGLASATTISSNSTNTLYAGYSVTAPALPPDGATSATYDISNGNGVWTGPLSGSSYVSFNPLPRLAAPTPRQTATTTTRSTSSRRETP